MSRGLRSFLALGVIVAACLGPGVEPAEAQQPLRVEGIYPRQLPIAQSTVTEKQTRIVEVLVSTVPVRAPLAGKIAGHALLALGQCGVLALAAPLALHLSGNSGLLSVMAPALGWFVPFLILGFVLLAALWAVTGPTTRATGHCTVRMVIVPVDPADPTIANMIRMARQGDLTHWDASRHNRPHD